MDVEKIKELKKKNGNQYVKNNDLLWYIIARLDDLEKELSNDRNEVTKIKTQIKIFWILLPVALSIIAYVAKLL